MNFGREVERATEQWQANQERRQRVNELYDKMVSSGIFSDDELSLARFEFGL
jgi:predicted nucleotidyltransferase